MPTYRIEGQVYDATSPDEAYAKHDQFKAKKPPTARPAAPTQSKLGTGQMLAQAVANFPSSAYELGKSTFEAVTSPIQTGKAIVDLGSSVLGKMGVTDASPEMADRVGQFYKDRYGSVENAKTTFASDPAGFLADAATILTGAGGALRAAPRAMGRSGGAVSRAGEKLQRVADVVDPLSVATKTVKGAGKLTSAGLGFTTGTGARAVEESAKAGFKGGKQGQAFVAQMRGNEPVQAVVDEAGQAVDVLREQRGQQYRSGMANVSQDATVLDMAPIRSAFNQIQQMGQYRGRSGSGAAQTLNEPAVDAVNKLNKIITDWENLDPTEFHTPEGLDALKKKIYNQSKGYQPGTPERLVADQMYKSVRQVVANQAPEYTRVMSDYEQATDLLHELEKSLSISDRATADTTLRKLQSILRNNANTNYGQRVALGEQLVGAGAETLFPRLAGQAMSSALPRSLSGQLTGAGVATNILQDIPTALAEPNTLLLAGLTSPRVVGETVYAAGQAVGKPAQLAKLLAQRGDELVRRNPEMAMAVDMAKRAGGKVDPRTARLLAYQLAQLDRATEEEEK
jgi:hypothetical protein